MEVGAAAQVRARAEDVPLALPETEGRRWRGQVWEDVAQLGREVDYLGGIKFRLVGGWRQATGRLRARGNSWPQATGNEGDRWRKASLPFVRAEVDAGREGPNKGED